MLTIVCRMVRADQPLESLYCVTATYELDKHRTVPFFGGTVVTVYNQANKGEVNGPLQNGKNMTLCGRAINTEDPSKLGVAPCWLPNYFAGPYWVLGVGEEYEWAVIIGGQPTEKYADGCSTKEEGTYNSGLWLFTRSQLPAQEDLDAMHALLKSQGVATSRLHPVVHEGCKYEGAFIK